MNIALINSNLYDINDQVKKGTEIFIKQYIDSLVQYTDHNQFKFTAFASGNSSIQIPIQSILPFQIANLKGIQENHKHIMFELALISRALQSQDQFDLFHVNIGDGDLIMPFAQFTTKPIVITLHHIIDAEFTRTYFSLFKDQPNIYFVAISESQKKLLPDLKYIQTIHHGIDTNQFKFNEFGGNSLMWAGRAIPSKGIDRAIQVAKAIKIPLNLFAIEPYEMSNWWGQTKMNIQQSTDITLETNLERSDLITKYQSAKAFILPLQWEEPFGLVFIEALSCGTPVISFARGSSPEIIKDGETGFLVNPSENDIRGNWITKKTGQEGLQEAVERLYSLSNSEYQNMRKNCRIHVEKNFTLKKMTTAYINIYQQLVGH